MLKVALNTITLSYPNVYRQLRQLAIKYIMGTCLQPVVALKFRRDQSIYDDHYYVYNIGKEITLVWGALDPDGVMPPTRLA